MTIFDKFAIAVTVQDYNRWFNSEQNPGGADLPSLVQHSVQCFDKQQAARLCMSVQAATAGQQVFTPQPGFKPLQLVRNRSHLTKRPAHSGSFHLKSGRSVRSTRTMSQSLSSGSQTATEQLLSQAEIDKYHQEGESASKQNL